jgi:hypothetical protein
LKLRPDSIDLDLFVHLEVYNENSPLHKSLTATLIFNPDVAINVFHKILTKDKGCIESQKIKNFITRFVDFRDVYGSLINIAVRILEDFPVKEGVLSDDEILCIRRGILFIETLYRRVFSRPGYEVELTSMINVIDNQNHGEYSQTLVRRIVYSISMMERKMPSLLS